MLNRLNSPITTLLALLGFIWLGWYSWHHYTPARPVTLIMEHGYSVADRQAMQSLLAKVKKEKRLSRENAEKLNDLYAAYERE